MLTTLACNLFCHKNNKSGFLLYRRCFLTFLLLLMFVGMTQKAHAQVHHRVAFWNVENLFDTWDDSTRNDDAFTPTGNNRWTSTRYKRKLANITKTIVAMGVKEGGTLITPLIIGLAEVENDKVLRDLCQGTPLRRYGYEAVHYDSPDQRGIDVALLYRKSLYVPFHTQAINVSDSAENFLTRDLLLVEGVTSSGDTLIAMVCHFPSKLGGSTADKRRMTVAHRLRKVMDSVIASHPGTALVVMGDFNGAPDEKELQPIVAADGNGEEYVNLMATIEPGRGTYKYQDYWSCLDHIIVTRDMADGTSQCRLRPVQSEGLVFDAGFLLIDDDKFLGRKIFRTYLGPRYLGGFSDHLPVYIDF